MADDLEEMKQVPASTGVEEIIRKRWSPRGFSGGEITSEELTRIFTAASWAASSFGEEPWRFIVGRKGSDTYAKLLDSLVVFNQGWAQSAPVLVLSAAKSHFTKNDAPNDYALHDTGAASANMCLQAVALGIHTHGMGGFDRIKARDYFEIPDSFELGAVWALGRLSDLDALPEELRGMEAAARKRKPLAEIVFNRWDVPAVL